MQEIPTRIQPGTLNKQEIIARERGIDVVKRLIRQVDRGGCVDEFLADQMVIFMALAVGGIVPKTADSNKESMEVNGVAGVGEGEPRKCEVLVGRVSLHAETAMRIAEVMIPDIEFITEKRDVGEVIVCQRKQGTK
jgi:RNA 3'-terminal phosphate cyclase